MNNYDDVIELVALAQQGDENAKEKLLLDNYPLIKSVIRRFKNRGVEYDDLYQMGCVGFVKAIKNFDKTYGVKFSTYAVPMIAGEVKRFLRDDGVVKVSRSIKSKAREINMYIAQYQNSHSHSPSIENISQHFDIEPTELAFIMESTKLPLSIHSKIDESEGSLSLGDMLTDTDTDFAMDKILLKQILDDLGERDKKIITLRYYMDKTQAEIAKILGVSQVQISRIENRIISNLRDKISN